MRVELPQDLDDVDAGFALLPPDNYQVKVVAVKGKSGPQGRYLQWNLAVINNEEWDGDVVDLMPLISINMPPKPKRTGSKGIYDAPRNILRKIPGIKLVEMERIKEYAYCCGAGAGVKSAFPELALYAAKTRIEEAEDTGADTLVSACPFCSTNLQDGIIERSSKLKYYDISELLLMSLGLEPEKLKKAIAEVA